MNFRGYFLFIFLVFFASFNSSYCYPFVTQHQNSNQIKGLMQNFFTESFMLQDETAKNNKKIYNKIPIQETLGHSQIQPVELQKDKNMPFLKTQGFEKRRILESNGNQQEDIQQGNFYQVTMDDYLITLRNMNLNIFRVGNPTLKKIASITYPDNNYLPQAIHAYNGYFCVILTKYQEEITTIIKFYKLESSKIIQKRQYFSRGQYKSSRRYKQFALFLLQDQIKSSNVTYQWTLSDKGQVQQIIKTGQSANTSTGGIGSWARIFALIPLDEQNKNDYKFATFLFCDYAWDLYMSSQLNVFIFANYYDQVKRSNFVSIQNFLLSYTDQKNWGNSRWIIYPGSIYSSYQVTQFKGYFCFVTIGAYGVQSVIVNIISMPNFDSYSGYVEKDVGLKNQTLGSCRWRKGQVFLMSRDGTITTYSVQLKKVTKIFKIKQYLISMLYPYGPNNILGIGYTSTNPRKVIISYFQVINRQLKLKQSLTLLNSNRAQFPYQYTSVSWFDTKQVQIDWRNKRMTIKIFTNQNQPYNNGYIQVYVNPLQNCISTLPIFNPCSHNQNQTAQLVGHILKHYDKTPTYDYNTGSSEGIIVSTTLLINGQSILITASFCQIQSRMIVGPFQKLSNSNLVVWYQDLCP